MARKSFKRTVNGIGRELDFESARLVLKDLLVRGVISPQAARLMTVACADANFRDCPAEHRDKVRAAIFKQMLMNCI